MPIFNWHDPEGDVSRWLRSAERLQTLRGSNLLDAPRIPRLDAITRMIALELETAYALVTLVSDDRQFFLSSYGLPDDVRQNSIDHSFCKYVGASNKSFRVVDAVNNMIVCHLLSIEEMSVHAYMGVPLKAPNGEILGTTCVIDTEPRVWTDEEEQLLTDYNVAVTAVVLHVGSWD